MTDKQTDKTMLGRFSNESDRDSMTNRLMNPELYSGLDQLAVGVNEHLEEVLESKLRGDMTVVEMEDSIRREVLTARLMSTDFERHEVEICEKYAAFAHETFSAERGEFRIDPFEGFAASYEKVDQWMARALEKGAVFISETATGHRHIFIKENLEGFQCALTLLGIRIRLDYRSQMTQMGLADGSWIELNDYREAALRCLIEDRFMFPKMSRDKLMAVPANFKNINWERVKEAHIATNTVDPFLEWLQRLPVWDGEKRLDDWMRMAGLKFAPDTDERLLQWANATVLLVAAARALEPGLKHDVMPVIIGPQGVGKSSSMAWLFPPNMRTRWFSDELRLNDRSNDRVESIQGAVIAEVAEMAGATNADIESLKAFLSRTSDYRRLAFRRNPEPFPRMCSLVGTANRNMLPNDPTGNRRFVALYVTDGNAGEVMKWLDANRLNLWAEAFSRAKANELMHLDSGLAEAQKAANERARSADFILENAVESWLLEEAKKASMTGKDYFKLANAAVGCGMIGHEDYAGKVPVGEGRRLSRVLQVLGCKSARRSVAGQQMRVWIYPSHMMIGSASDSDNEMMEIH